MPFYYDEINAALEANPAVFYLKFANFISNAYIYSVL